MNSQQLFISDNAVKQIKKLLLQESEKDTKLRVIVNGGGCAGFQYSFAFDTQQNEEDITFEKDSVQVIIDDVSLNILQGSEIDYVESLIGSSFQIKNPNAKSTCGCGTSFSM